MIPRELMTIPKKMKRESGLISGVPKKSANVPEKTQSKKYRAMLSAMLKMNAAEYSLLLFCSRLMRAAEKPLSTSTLLNAVNIARHAIMLKSLGESIRVVNTPTIRANTCTPNLSRLLQNRDLDLLCINDEAKIALQN
jgi:hypothetical protein